MQSSDEDSSAADGSAESHPSRMRRAAAVAGDERAQRASQKMRRVDALLLDESCTSEEEEQEECEDSDFMAELLEEQSITQELAEDEAVSSGDSDCNPDPLSAACVAGRGQRVSRRGRGHQLGRQAGQQSSEGDFDRWHEAPPAGYPPVLPSIQGGFVDGLWNPDQNAAPDLELQMVRVFLGDLVGIITVETNRYAELRLAEWKTKGKVRRKETTWVPVTVQEMEAWIGCFCIMALQKNIEGLASYFHNDPVIANPLI